MFGIGGGELVLIIFIALMLFGAEKIPDIARTLGKGMAQLKNATNEIKSEIQRSADTSELQSLKQTFDNQVQEVKKEVDTGVQPQNSLLDITPTINQVKENIEDLTGPIKRQM